MTSQQPDARPSTHQLVGTVCSPSPGEEQAQTRFTVLLDDGTRRRVPTAALQGLRSVRAGQRLSLQLSGHEVTGATLPPCEVQVHPAG